MSRQISRCLLFYLSVGAILSHGLSRRIPRRASCPSCSKDCPEALTVQLPWNPQQESNLQDFSINPLQNYPYSRFMRGRISQDTERSDNGPLSQNSMPFGNDRKFLQPKPSKNFIFKNYLNNSPRYLDRREIFSQDRPARGYPRVIPSQQIFDRSESLFFRNPRNKYSESLSGDYKKTKNYIKLEEDPSEVQQVYRADRNAVPSWKSSRDTPLNVIQSERFSPEVENIYRSRREDALDGERSTIEKSSNSASQLRYRERHNPVEFGPSEVKRDPFIKNTDISKSTKEFFDNRDIAKDSSSNLEQLRNNLLELHPAKKQKIIAKDDTEQINSKFYNSKFLQDSHVWKSRKDGESFDSLMRTNTRRLKNGEKEDVEDMKDYFDANAEQFMDDEDIKEYFGEAKQDTIEIERDNYNRVLPQNIWKGTKSKKLPNDLDFMSKNSRETNELGLYSEESDEYFQDEENEDKIFQNKAYTGAETARAPVINAYNAFILPRYLNIVNDKKYPAKSEMQELLEARSSLRANPVTEMDHKFFQNKAVIENNARIQDLSKGVFDVEEYRNPIADKRNNVRIKNEALTELDPDLLDDIEDPPVGTTESTPK